MKVGGICPDCHKYYDGDICPKCDNVKSGNSLNVIMDIEPHYNRGLGEYVTSRSDYRAKLKEKGLIEIGNEKKHVDPVNIRKIKENEQTKQFNKVRPEAYRMLDSHSYSGRPEWN